MIVTVILIILGWVVCGLLAVFIGGLVDKLDNDNDCPIVVIFILGPLGLFTVICALLWVLYILNYYSIPGLNILNRIYFLGRGDK